MPRHRDLHDKQIHSASFVDSSDPSGVYSAEDLTDKLWVDRSTVIRSVKIRDSSDSAWEILTWAVGTATPESSVTAIPGALFIDSTNGELYIKVTGTGNTGWKKMTHA